MTKLAQLNFDDYSDPALAYHARGVLPESERIKLAALINSHPLPYQAEFCWNIFQGREPGSYYLNFSCRDNFIGDVEAPASEMPGIIARLLRVLRLCRSCQVFYPQIYFEAARNNQALSFSPDCHKCLYYGM